MADWQIGQAVTWLQTLRGGYGYVYPVEAVVVAVHRERVRIAVHRRDGTTTNVSVKPTSLQLRPGCHD